MQNQVFMAYIADYLKILTGYINQNGKTAILNHMKNYVIVG